MGPSGRLPELRISFCREIRNSAGSELTDLSLLPFPFLSSSHSSSLFPLLSSPPSLSSRSSFLPARARSPTHSASSLGGSSRPVSRSSSSPLLRPTSPSPSSSLFSRSLGPLAPLLLASFHSALPRVSGEGCSGRNQCRFPTASSAAGRRHWLPGFGGT